MDDAAPADYAAFAPLVMEYAEIGDEIALLIVRDAAQHIERFIETIFAKGASRCVLMGGLAPRIKPWLRARVVEKLSAPLGDALDGALILAGLPIGALASGRCWRAPIENQIPPNPARIERCDGRTPNTLTTSHHKHP